MKDLEEAQRIFQVLDEALERDFPPLRSLDAFTNNLPPQRSSFVGRERELAEVCELVDGHRLVTLTGIGGCGKTRLAVQVGAEKLQEFPDGVFFVDLSAVGSGALVASTVAKAVGLAAGPGQPSPLSITDQVVRNLSARAALVILDNCEHLLDDCAALVDALLGRCARLRVLATSREALEVDGEQSWRVPSLSVPAGEDASTSEAVTLFKTRAKGVDPQFELTPDNVEAVAEICRRLDGIPLAIEFAAARVSHLSARQIAERLDDMFKLLTGGRRRVQRQQTLQAALDWSHELLEPDEQRVFARLAVFSGGFTMRAAEGVCAGEHIEIVDVLGSLVSKSLVATETSGDEMRFRLLETVRLYAEDKLRVSGEADAVRTRHRDWYQSCIETIPLVDALLDLNVQVELGREIGNFRAALAWSAAQNRHDLMGRMVSHLAGYWGNATNYDEGYEWARRVVEEAGTVGIDERIECLALMSWLAMTRLDPKAADYAREAIAISEGSSSPGVGIAAAMIGLNLGILAAATSSEESAGEARRWSDESIVFAGRTDPGAESWTLMMRGQLELMLADYAEAVRRLESAVEVATGIRSRRTKDQFLAVEWGLVAVVRHLAGDVEGAVDAARRALESGAAAIDPSKLVADSTIAQYHHAAAAIAFAADGDHAAARKHARKHLGDAEGASVPLMLNDAFIIAAAVAFLGGDAARAARLLAAARYAGDAATNLGPPFRTAAGAALYRHYVPLVRAALAGEQARRLRDEGKAMTLDEAAAYAFEGLDEA